MCFSATVSFVAAGLTGAAGAAALSRARGWREAPLAAVPLVFAAQQTAEGFLWLSLSGGPSAATPALAFGFLFAAGVAWPVLTPVAVALVEPQPGRRRVAMVCAAIGVGVGGFFLAWLSSHSIFVAAQNGHIVYDTGLPAKNAVAFAYVAATVAPLLISSSRAVNALGVVVAVGYAAAYFSYRDAFVSVWCFFAAAASAAIVWRFVQPRPAAQAA